MSHLLSARRLGSPSIVDWYPQGSRTAPVGAIHIRPSFLGR